MRVRRGREREDETCGLWTVGGQENPLICAFRALKFSGIEGTGLGNFAVNSVNSKINILGTPSEKS